VRVRDDGKQRGLSHVREADEPHIGEELELQRDDAVIARQAGLRKARRLTGRGGEMLVAPAAPAAFRSHIIFSGGHIVHDGAALGVPEQRSPGNSDTDTLAVLARAALALSRRAVFGDIFSFVTEIDQRGHVVVGNENNIAAASAVAAVRSAGGNIFFAVKSHRPVSAVSGADGYRNFVNKW
jgi:hypothetical protein